MPGLQRPVIPADVRQAVLSHDQQSLPVADPTTRSIRIQSRVSRTATKRIRDDPKVKKSGSESLKVQKIKTIFCVSVIILGLIWQIWQLSWSSSGYFSYETVTRVIVGVEETFIYPTVSFCFYTGDVFKWRDAFKELPHLESNVRSSLKNFNEPSLETFIRNTPKYNPEKSHQVDHILKTSLTVEQIFNYSMKPHDIFQKFLILSNVDYDFQEVECTPIQSLISSRECYTLNSNTKIEYNLTSLQMTLGPIPGLIQMIQLKESFVERVTQSFIYMHEPHDFPSPKNSRAITLSSLDQFFQLTYQKYESYLLPPPYPTNCQNYTESARSNCFLSCLSKKSFKKFGQYSFQSPVINLNNDSRDDLLKRNPEFKNFVHHDLSKNQIMSGFGVQRNQSIKREMEEISKECEYNCRFPECQAISYSPMILSTSTFDRRMFAFVATFFSDIETYYVKKLGLVGYLTDALACFGFWLGLSVLSVFTDLVDFILEICLHIKFKSNLSETKKRMRRSSTVILTRK